MILGSLDDFLVGLQAVARFSQELTDGAVTDRVPVGAQFLRELLGTLTCPPQGRFRIAPRHGVNQRSEIGLWRRIFLGQPTSSGPRVSHSVHRHHLRLIHVPDGQTFAIESPLSFRKCGINLRRVRKLARTRWSFSAGVGMLLSRPGES